MKKILLFLPVLFFCIQGFSQKSNDGCTFDYNLEVTKRDDFMTTRDLTATFKWDFTKLNWEASDVKIEVIPIKDCMNEIQGTEFKDGFRIVLKEATGSQELSHRAMGTKCFKWRLVVSSEGCEKTYSWTYFSFVD
ncbi:hypothetical protein [Neptunitalea lumnitzerae]|uniref:Uncharacterized protein n=1 Tax=Neptunitalea lumnitzerae TaxID=2965509 RepID=A0ABQ5MKL8_9FLAO|nr:hypothetical protein [Neptunitalea sp. Y10]GLB49923.1 hypothetical protein Y10_22910 [Neptunitalea sp. Y10]